MNRKTAIGFIIIMLMSLFPSFALADVLTSGLPDVDGGSYIVVEGSSGEVLFGNNYQVVSEMADLSKMMTAILAIEKADMDKVITVGKIPESVPGGISSVFLREGEKVKMEDLLKAAIIYSANDAAYTIAGSIGGNEEKFVAMMNEKAKELGMNNTNFANSYGASAEGQKTTAEDMAILGRYVMKNDTYREIAGSKSFQWNGEAMPAVFDNKNTFLTAMAEATGVKSGYNESAKWTLVASAKKDGRELIGVILGSSAEANMVRDMTSILNYGFNNTKMVPVVQKGAFEANLVFDEKRQTMVIAGEDFSLVRPVDSNAIVETVNTFNAIELPIKKDQKVGLIEIKVDGETLYQVPLVAVGDVSKPINVLLLITSIMTILYILQMVLRASRMIKKNVRSQQSMKQSRPVREGQAPRPKSSVSSTEGRKKLGDRSPSDRNQSPRF